jgi:tetratricopeptide (TPR) repeat protein
MGQPAGGEAHAAGDRSVAASQLDPGQTDPGQTDPDQTGPDQTGPGQMGPGQMDPSQTDTGKLDPGQADPGQADHSAVPSGDHSPVDARQVHLDTGAVPAPAEVEAAPDVQNLPAQPEAPFVGRDSELDALAGVPESGVVAQAIVGVDGVGKTELVLRHAWAHRDRYPLVWWVTADTSASIQAGLAELAYRLVPVLQTETTAGHAAEWAVGWLQCHPGVLLVLDNVEQPADIEQLLGRLAGTHVLVTTRRDLGWQPLGLATVPLGVLDPAAAAGLLLELTGAADEDAAAGLAADLECLPLALDQAAAYVTEHRATLAGYRRLLAADAGHPLSVPAEDTPADRAVARVLSLTRTTVDGRIPLAGRLLDIMAWLGPDLLPRDVLAPTGSAAEVSGALAVLASYRMVSLREDAVSVHRLVQTLTRLDLPSEQAEDQLPRVRWWQRARSGRTDSAQVQAAEAAVGLLRRAIPPGDDPRTDVDAWPRWRALLPHIDALAAVIPAAAQTATWSSLLDRAGTYQQGQGLYTPAIAKLQAAMILDRQLHGPDHPTTMAARNNLGLAYADAGRTAEAVSVFEAVRDGCERLLGPDHPDTLTACANLASAYAHAGRTGEAATVIEALLAARERLLGPDHPDTLATRDHLAGAYADAGRIAEAVTVLEAVLATAERLLGPDHPRTLTTRNNLGLAYRGAGRTAEAVTVLEAVLATRERLLGPDHPRTLTTRHNLAVAYADAGRTADAAELTDS